TRRRCSSELRVVRNMSIKSIRHKRSPASGSMYYVQRRSHSRKNLRMGDVNQRLFLTRYLPEISGPILEVGSKDYGNTASFGVAELFPRIAWSNRLYSTNVPDEFIEIPNDGSGVDNQLAKYTEKRKYLPYLQVHMLGIRAGESGEARTVEVPHAPGVSAIDAAGEQYLRWYYDTN